MIYVTVAVRVFLRGVAGQILQRKHGEGVDGRSVAAFVSATRQASDLPRNQQAPPRTAGVSIYFCELWAGAGWPPRLQEAPEAHTAGAESAKVEMNR